MTDQIATSTTSPLDVDRLTTSLVTSLDIARSLQMRMLERLLEMSLMELGHTVAAQQRYERDGALR